MDPLGPTATALGIIRDVVARQSSQNVQFSPQPATWLSRPPGVTFNRRHPSESAMYALPTASTATPLIHVP